ncbi:MAG: hypothetical protein WC209_12000 [Ignavibacteriaceae bacterium]|jgi:hypothetical protein
MKTFCITLLIALFFSISIKVANAQTTETKLNQVELVKDLINNNYKHALDNFLQGLKSKNTGVLRSCIYFSGKYKIDKAVKPLVRILNSFSANEDIKILIALSLYEIGSDDGMYYVYQVSKFGSSEKLKRTCFLLYDAFLLNKNVRS